MVTKKNNIYDTDISSRIVVIGDTNMVGNGVKFDKRKIPTLTEPINDEKSSSYICKYDATSKD